MGQPKHIGALDIGTCHLPNVTRAWSHCASAAMTGALFAVSRSAPRLIPRFGAKPLMVAGLVPVVTGRSWLAHISPATSYLPGILGPMLLLGAGLGLTFVPLTVASLHNVRQEDSGGAASMVNVTQQVGGALGLAILVTVFGHASRAAMRHPIPGDGPVAEAHQVLAHGIASSFTVAAIFDVCALIVIMVVIRLRQAPAAVDLPYLARGRSIRVLGPRSPSSRRHHRAHRHGTPHVLSTRLGCTSAALFDGHTVQEIECSLRLCPDRRAAITVAAVISIRLLIAAEQAVVTRTARRI